MSAFVLNSLKKVPFPLFGSASTALAFSSRKASLLPKFAPWAVAGGVGALWFVWPAVDEEWKQSWGFSSTAAPPVAAPEEKKVELSPAALEKVEKAYVVETKELTQDEKDVVKAVAAGDYSLLEKEWDAFQEKASVPGDGDDDDEDDDDEDDEDEDEEDEDEED